MARRLASLFTLVAAVGLSAPAYARFGKSDDRTRPSNSGSSGPRESSGSHSASGVGAPRPRENSPRRQSYRRAPNRYYYAPSRPWYSRGWGPGYYGYYGYYGYAPYSYYDAPPVYVNPPPASVTEQVEEPSSDREDNGARSLRLNVGAEGQVFNGGGSMTFGLGLEGERAGFTSSFTHLGVRAVDYVASGVVDTIQLVNLRATYAVLAGSRGRLRLEGGVHAANAIDLLVLGPALGVSGEVWVAGPFVLEAAATLVPFPYRELQYRAGAGLGLGPLAFRVGWKTQVLDDNGLVNGEVHPPDVFSGPYAGLSLVF